jgi:hypothetical protein
MADEVPKVTKLPLTDRQRARARRAQSRALNPQTRQRLSDLGQAAGVFGVPRAFYYGAALATAVNAVAHNRPFVPDWFAVTVLVALGLL